MTGAAGPLHAAHPGEERGSPVNLASRSGVLDKLSVTAEMSTTKRSGTGLKVGLGGAGGRAGVSEEQRIE